MEGQNGFAEKNVLGILDSDRQLDTDTLLGKIIKYRARIGRYEQSGQDKKVLVTTIKLAKTCHSLAERGVRVSNHGDGYSKQAYDAYHVAAQLCHSLGFATARSKCEGLAEQVFNPPSTATKAGQRQPQPGYTPVTTLASFSRHNLGSLPRLF